MDLKSKYLKYKQKYINLKKKNGWLTYKSNARAKTS